MLRRLFVLAVACGVLALPVAAFTFTGTKWTSSSATMQLQLGANSTPLADGSASWGASAENALARWNAQISAFRFNVVRDSTAVRSGGNRVNNVHFAADVYGQTWGASVLAVTLTYYSGSTTVETDVLFNNRLNWDSYRGPQRFTGTGQALYDFHRVALHEFGHALGLDHPDEEGQSVNALMNSRVSSLDDITSDDIAGVQTLYGASSAPTTPTVAAPVITTHPTNRTVTAGQSTTFSVAASSTAALTYQWLKAGATISGATTSSYTIASVATADAGGYSARVTNSAGSATSNTATLTVTAATTPTTPTVPTTPTTPTIGVPTISSQPSDRNALEGTSFTLTVAASGTSPFSYQWRRDGMTLAGATSASYTVAAANASHAGNYTVTVSNAAGTAVSATARVIVGTAPVIVTQPASQNLAAGARLTLTFAVSGSPTATVQWYRSDAAIPGATSPTYTVSAVQGADAGIYRAAATNVFGTVSTTPVTVAIQTPPTITTQPAAQTVNAGERVQFFVVAAGTPTLAYQWFRDSVEIAGATSAAYTLSTARAADGGIYAVSISNAIGSVTSASAALTVRHSRLVNLSTRAFVPAGGTLTPGFFIRGTGQKTVVLRAVGPTLSTFGVGTALGETQLDLISQSTAAVIASNSDWGGSAALRAAFVNVGAFPLAADSKDAALQTELAPSGYTARIAPGAADMAGITLAEIYDSDPVSSAAQLVNVSTLGFVGTGENVLTAGFVISGNASKRVLIRAIGPGLAPFGVANLLPDPQLGLVPLGAAEPLATNDNWSDETAVRNAFGSAGAFALTAGSGDAALVITLEPGAYTVVVSSVDGRSTGNALVEIYDLD